MLVASLLDIGLGLVGTVGAGDAHRLRGVLPARPRAVAAATRATCCRWWRCSCWAGWWGCSWSSGPSAPTATSMAGGAVAGVTFLTLLAFWLLSAERQGVDLALDVQRQQPGGVLSAVVGMGAASIVGPVFGIDHPHAADGAGPARAPAAAPAAGGGARHVPPQRHRGQPGRAGGRPHRRRRPAGAGGLLLPRHRQAGEALLLHREPGRRRQPLRQPHPRGQRPAW